MMAETMAPPACRVASWGLPLTIVALQPALIPALSERYFTIGKTAHNERRSSTGSGGTSPALLPRQGLALGAKPGQSYAPRVNKMSVALTIALALASLPTQLGGRIVDAVSTHSGCCLMPRATG